MVSSLETGDGCVTASEVGLGCPSVDEGVIMEVDKLLDSEGIAVNGMVTEVGPICTELEYSEKELLLGEGETVLGFEVETIAVFSLNAKDIETTLGLKYRVSEVY